MILAIMETESKTFEAIANHAEGAKEAIREKWNENQQRLNQNGWINEPLYFRSIKALEKEYDINTYEIEIGQCILTEY